MGVVQVLHPPGPSLQLINGLAVSGIAEHEHSIVLPDSGSSRGCGKTFINLGYDYDRW